MKHQIVKRLFQQVWGQELYSTLCPHLFLSFLFSSLSGSDLLSLWLRTLIIIVLNQRF